MLEVVIETYDAVHVGTGQIEMRGNAVEGVIGDVPQRVLDGVQYRQQGTWRGTVIGERAGRGLLTFQG